MKSNLTVESLKKGEARVACYLVVESTLRTGVRNDTAHSFKTLDTEHIIPVCKSPY